MACFLSGLLALSLATEPPAIERLTPVSVRAMAFTGAGLVTLGVAFEINGLAGIDSRALVPEWREQATFNLAGGLGSSVPACASSPSPPCSRPATSLPS